MGLGHILDANTFALYKLDEPTAPNNSVLDSTGRSNLTSSLVSRPEFTTSANGALARHFRAQQRFFGTPHSDTMFALWGEWTFEAWIYLDTAPAATVVVGTYTVGTDDASANSNFLLQCTITSALRMNVFWEFNVGSDVSATQSIGDTVPVQQWCHLGWRKTLPGDASVEFFINGLSQQEIGGLTNSTHGVNSFWSIGALGSGNNFPGSMKEIHVSSVARDASYILADAQRVDETHIQDANTLHLWRLNDTPDFVDSSGNGNHLTADGTPQPVQSLILDGGYAKFFPNNAGGVGYSRPEWLSFWQGEWTFETWFRLADNNAAARTLVAYGGVSGAGSALNYLARVVINTNRTISILWESGTGTSQTTTSTVILPNLLDRYHIGVRKVSDGGGQAHADVFINGVFAYAGPSRPDANDGSSPNCAMYLGGGGVDTQMFGRMDDARLSNIPRSESEISESYARGLDSTTKIIFVGGL